MPGLPDDRPRCPNCGAATPPEAVACPLCGTALTAPPEEALLRELEALTQVVAEAAKPEETAAKAAEVVPAEPVAVVPPSPEPVVSPEVPKESPPTEAPKAPEAARAPDLADFVRRVEKTVTARARRPVRPPQPSLAAAPLLTFGGLVLATGLFLLPATAFVGTVTTAAGLALLFMGGMLRRLPSRRPIRRPATQRRPTQ